jgi:hypothetical protein
MTLLAKKSTDDRTTGYLNKDVEFAAVFVAAASFHTGQM